MKYKLTFNLTDTNTLKYPSPFLFLSCCTNQSFSVACTLANSRIIWTAVLEI